MIDCHSVGVGLIDAVIEPGGSQLLRQLRCDRQLALDSAVIPDRSSMDADAESRHKIVEEAVVMIRVQHENDIWCELDDLGAKARHLTKELLFDVAAGARPIHVGCMTKTGGAENHRA